MNDRTVQDCHGVDLPVDARWTFDEIAEHYDRFRPGYPPALFDVLFELAELPEHGRILEIGTGTGKATVPMARHGHSILGLEPGTRLAAIARKNLRDLENIEILCQTFDDWPLDENRFDLVLSAQAIHWVPPQMRFEKTAQSLVPSGRLAILANAVIPDSSRLRSELDTIYAEHEPQLLGLSPTLWYARNGEFHKSFIASRRFESVIHRKWEWNQCYTAEQYVGLMRTHSNHQLLRPDRLEALLDPIRRLIESSDDTIQVAYEAHLYVGKRASIHTP